MPVQRFFAPATLPLSLSVVLLAVAIPDARVQGETRIAGKRIDSTELDGEWIYVEDRTANRPIEQQGPPMSAKFSFGSEDGAVILVSGHGSGHRDVRVALDGSATKVDGTTEGTYAEYQGAWTDGTFAYETKYVRKPGEEPSPASVIRREFTLKDDGLLVRVTLGSPVRYEAIGLYRQAKDIPMPEAATAKIDDIAWLSGAWVGTRGSSGKTSIEERWSPPRGGSIFAVSRTVTSGSLRAFEYLRIVERDSGLVYVAQPNGGTPTEFVLTELTENRAVFDNPRHDYPKRITYSLTENNELKVSIGFTKGGSPRRFEFKREQ